MPHSHTSMHDLKVMLASRLDSSKVFWTDTELGYLINEAIRTWQLLTNYWRERDTFNTVSGTAFYDLRSALSGVLGYTITTQQSITQMEYSLLEPPTPAAWSGSDMFVMTDLVSAFQNRRNRLILDTGCETSRILGAASPVPIPREILPDSVVDVLRVAWIDVDDVYYHLWRNQEFQANAYLPEWAVTPGTPEMFSILTTPPLTVLIMPPPLDTGQLEYIVTQTPNDLDETDATNKVSIPDDVEWVARWGALADLLLGSGESNDEARGKYAQVRYEHGAKAAAMYRPVVQYELNGVTLIPDSLHNHDAYNPDWQNTSDEPECILDVSQNLTALSPVPDGIYSVTCDVVRNAPVLAHDGAFIQVSRGTVEAIVSYAQHIGSFKMGGAEFLATMPLFASFLKQAQAHNARLAELNETVRTALQSMPATVPSSMPLAELEGSDAE